MQNPNEILWTAAFLNERFTEIVSPLGWSFVGALFEETALRDPLRYMGFPDAATIPATRLWHGHPYINVEIFQIFYKPFPDALVPTDAVRYFPNGDIAFRHAAPYPPARGSLRYLLPLGVYLARDLWNSSPLNYWKWERFVRYHTTQMREFQKRLAQFKTPQDILRVIDGTYALDRQLLRIHRWSLTYADVFYKILTEWTGDLAQSLISDVPNKTREVNHELSALAQRPAPLTADLLQRIQSRAPLNQQEQQTADALEQFLERHGHRAFSLDLAQPTFADDPMQLLALVQSAPSANESLTRQDVRTIAPRVEKNLRRWQRVFFRPILALARRYAQLREDQRYYWQKSLAVTRHAYLKLGEAFTADQVLSRPQDIFYATRSEIREYYAGQLEKKELSAKIRARREEWAKYEQAARERGADSYPSFLRGDVPVLETKSLHVNGTEWRGRGISPGIARGVARVVHDPRELGRVGTGEILVAPSTDPAWTPVFARLAGLALERGGVLSHGAVVAREYHLPAVAAIANLTQEIQDGEEIQVDGTNGIVRRIR